jgi:hypothetical protein
MSAHTISARAAPNNGMHPTRDTVAFKFLDVAGGRVMPGVGRFEFG